jgi:hypothetical protein
MIMANGMQGFVDVFGKAIRMLLVFKYTSIH